MRWSTEARNQLRAYFESKFGFGGAGQWAQEYQPAMGPHVAWGAPSAQVVSQMLQWLEAHGVVDARWFHDKLLGPYPKDVDTVQEIMAHFGFGGRFHLPPQRVDELYRLAVQFGLQEPFTIAGLRNGALSRHVGANYSLDRAGYLRESLDKANALTGPLGEPDMLVLWLEWAIAQGTEKGLDVTLFRSTLDGLGVSAPMAVAVVEARGLELQRALDAGMDLADPDAWIAKFQSRRRQVGAVVIGGKVKGTAFLIGRNLVMTNWHVVEKVQVWDGVEIRFDYTADDSEGTTFGVSGIAGKRAYSAQDDKPDPKADPETDELDFAILKLDTNVEDDRGWIEWPAEASDLAVNTGLAILQHPEGGPIKLALNSMAIQKVNGNKTRVRYGINTREGSSGSPVFDMEWRLVALHHAGNKGGVGLYNQGVPITAIIGSLDSTETMEITNARRT